MTEVSRQLFRASLSIALVAAITVGCNKKPVASTPPPAPAPPPAAAQPSVSLTASPTSIEKGGSSTLNWTSADATLVTISPDVGTVTAQGSTKVTPADSTTYTVTASGPGGSANATARVTVAGAPVSAAAELTLDQLFLKEVRDAFFDFNKADIRPDAREALGKTAEFLRNYPQLKVTIEGHCDERGSTEYNLALGDRRASAVKQYLISMGISADRLNTVSFGKEKPFCMQTTEDCYQQNRRGHFVRSK